MTDRPPADRPRAAGRLRILHVSAIDPQRPGNDPGALRAREINRRLATTHDITVTSRRRDGGPGGTVDGVRQLHGGLPWGERLATLTWRLTLPLTVLRQRPDLIVEDCGGPLPLPVIPWPLRRPTVAFVSDEPAARGSQPIRGLRPSRHLVATSEALGAELRHLWPARSVTVVADALPDDAFVPRHQSRQRIVYYGPLDRAHGVDLLIAAWAPVAASSDAELLLVGDGPDEDRLRARVRRLGLGSHVRFSGRVDPAARSDILAGACVVVATGTYESDAQVAAAALAVASPVVAFDVPSMRGVLDDHTAVLVAPGDTTAFADEMLALSADPVRARALGDAGPARVADRRWDAVTARVDAVYGRASTRRHLVTAPAGSRAHVRRAAPTTGPGALPAAAAVASVGRSGDRPVVGRWERGWGWLARPRHTVAAVLVLIAVVSLTATGVIAATQPSGGSALADPSHRHTTEAGPHGPTMPITDARTSRPRRPSERVGHRDGRGGAKTGAGPSTPSRVDHGSGRGAGSTVPGSLPTSPPSTITPRSTPSSTVAGRTGSEPTTSVTSPPTTTGSTAGTTPPVETRQVSATLVCSGSATVTVHGTGGGTNTLTVRGAGATRSASGADASLELSVGSGSYTSTDTSTAGDPSMHWGWSPSSACTG